MIWQQIQQYPALARCSEQWQGCEPWQGRFWKPLNRAEADLWWTNNDASKVPADAKVEAEEGRVESRKADRCRMMGLDMRELEEVRRARGIHARPDPCVCSFIFFIF